MFDCNVDTNILTHDLIIAKKSNIEFEYNKSEFSMRYYGTGMTILDSVLELIIKQQDVRQRETDRYDNRIIYETVKIKNLKSFKRSLYSLSKRGIFFVNDLLLKSGDNKVTILSWNQINRLTK